MKQPAVFTIPASAAFAETLAKGLIARIGDDPLTLSSAVIYLPTRRAARSFGDAFVRAKGGAAAPATCSSSPLETAVAIA